MHSVVMRATGSTATEMDGLRGNGIVWPFVGGAEVRMESAIEAGVDSSTCSWLMLYLCLCLYGQDKDEADSGFG